MVATRNGREASEIIKFRKGLPQGDALCPRLFTVCLNPIAWKISASEGYRLSKPIDTTITDLLYIDDLKIFAASESKLSSVMNSVRAAMEDVGLIWNPISICHYGRRPRFLAAPPLTLNLPLMASKETLEQVKNLLKQELSPINAKLDGLTTKLSDIDTAVNFLSGKYDALLNQLKDTNRKVNSHASDVAKVKENLKEIEKLAYNASSEVEQIAQYLRRDCLEITGIATNEECSAEAIIKSIGDVIGVPLKDNDISIAHPIPTYKVGAPPKLIVKFTRRSVRDKFYLNRGKLARKKAKDLPNLNLSSEAHVFVSESLTSFKKKLFGDVNKVKKHLKWKYIWTYNGRIFIREDENKPSFSFENAEDLHKFNLEHTNRARR